MSQSKPHSCCGGGAPQLQSQEQLIALVEKVLQNPEQRMQLVPLLEEVHPLYRDKTQPMIADMRGWILLAFAEVGLPEAALPFVLEELESGIEGYLVGAAARALRSFEQPRAEFAPFLLQAFGNTRDHDEALSFDHYAAVVTQPGTGTTTLREIATSFGWLGAHGASALEPLKKLRDDPLIGSKMATCLQHSISAIETAVVAAPAAAQPAVRSCCSAKKAEPLAGPVDEQTLQATELQDQDGRRLRFEEFFHGRPSVVAFFYTRCENSLKCPVTMAKLAGLQRMLEDAGLADQVRTAALTYDPVYDIAPRLRDYGESLAMRMNENHCLLRTTGDFGILRDYFQLGVNYSGSIVNRHRTEAFLLDPQGKIVDAMTRLRWDERTIVEKVRALV